MVDFIGDCHQTIAVRCDLVTRRIVSLGRFFAGLLAGLIVACSNSPLFAEDAQPNVVLIVIDNLGWADLGCYGSKFHQTPNIDRLAREGMRFTQAYAAAPIGAPTRAAILTGRYPQRMNITASFAVSTDDSRYRLRPPVVSRELPLSEISLAEAMKSAGYATGCIGKWHLGGPGFGPREQGFDVNIAGDATGVKYREIAPYVDPQGNLIPGLEQAPAGEFLTDRLAAKAQKFINDHKTKPFFLYLPHFAVHMPSEVKPDILAKYGSMPTEPSGKQNNPVYAALMESMDDAVGRILATLDDLHLTQRTLILLTSDNGGVCNDHGQIVPPTLNSPLRDGMGHLYEGGVRIPLIIKWPGVIQGGVTSDEVVSCLDLYPTVVDASTMPKLADPEKPLDGKSLLPVLKGQQKLEREAIYWHYPHYNSNAGSKPGAAIRAGDWKLIEFYETGRQELFNVGKEPGEGSNLIEKHADVARELLAKLGSWRESVGAKRPIANPDYEPNPPRADGTITLPASTADVFGIMLRYEPLPHKDTLGYWVRQEDWASFEFTVKRPGRYRVVAHVGCGTNGGSLVHFAVGDQILPLTVPATGHFQNFVPQEMGEVRLDKPGRYSLAVKPQKKEGVAVMDVRQIQLVPLP